MDLNIHLPIKKKPLSGLLLTFWASPQNLADFLGLRVSPPADVAQDIEALNMELVPRHTKCGLAIANRIIQGLRIRGPIGQNHPNRRMNFVHCNLQGKEPNNQPSHYTITS